jgi:hypothetical protein
VSRSPTPWTGSAPSWPPGPARTPRTPPAGSASAPPSPLGLCLLPAFLLIGIVPVVAGLVADLAG